ncbi:MAG: hypothetical protein HY717_15720 [Planctomycetes bacterium]|nr:hypothetical protein [Planctomycetota bacterium]
MANFHGAAGRDRLKNGRLAGIPAGLAAAVWLLRVASGPVMAVTAVGHPDWNQLEKQFKEAAAASGIPRLAQLVDAVAPHDDPRAAKLLIQYALSGVDYGLELKAGEILFTMTSAEAKKAIYEQANKNFNYKTRLILLGVVYALYQKSDPDALVVLQKALWDPRNEVKFAALRLLKLAKDVNAVDSLIALLEKVEKAPKGRLHYDIHAALKEITLGHDFELAADWKIFWDTRRGQKLEPPSRTEGKTGVLHKFFDIALDSDRIAFVIDVSGSMSRRDPPPAVGKKQGEHKTEPIKKGKQEKDKEQKKDEFPIERERLYRVKQELIRTIRSLPEHVHFTVQSFASEIKYLNDNPALIAATPANKEKAVEWVNKLESLGETWTDTACERLFADVKGFDTAILLSDGQPYRGKALDEKEVLDGIKAANRFARCRIHTIGFKQAGENLKRFLFALAGQNDGKATMLE